MKQFRNSILHIPFPLIAKKLCPPISIEWIGVTKLALLFQKLEAYILINGRVYLALPNFSTTKLIMP